ncbi:hypothetical protein N9948_02240, partial [bacterium]|nr:hypothetical protein [bacterium]
MSYNFLVNATKNRIITELRDAFANHPRYKNLEILNKFPYEERIQEGIILRNATAARMPLSADNFQGTVCSYTTVAGHQGSRSLSVEWVREDSQHLAERMVREDFSSQFTSFPQLNRTILLNEVFVRNHLDLSPAQSHKSIEVYINNDRVFPLLVDAENKQIVLQSPPLANSKVEVSYWSRNLSAPGIYQLEVTGGDPLTNKFEFMLDALLDKQEIIFDKAEGTETTAQLKHFPVWPCSLKLRENDSLLEEHEDYIIDLNSGIITFLHSPPVLKGSKVTADYRIKGLTTGPFDIPCSNYANNTALPGIVIAFGRGVSIDDKHFIVINNKREITAQEFSGKWDMGISLEVYAKDSVMIEEIVDITTSHLLFFRKSEL